VLNACKRNLVRSAAKAALVKPEAYDLSVKLTKIGYSTRFIFAKIKIPATSKLRMLYNRQMVEI